MGESRLKERDRNKRKKENQTEKIGWKKDKQKE